MRSVRPVGRYTAGGTVGRTAGQAMVCAVIVQLPAWGPARALSSAPGPVILG